MVALSFGLPRVEKEPFVKKLTSRRATVMTTALTAIPPSPRRCRVLRPAFSTRKSWRDRQTDRRTGGSEAKRTNERTNTGTDRNTPTSRHSRKQR